MSLGLRNMLTESDNATLCPVRVGWAVALLMYHAGAAWMLFGQGLKLDIATMGEYVKHMIMLFGTTGASIGAKSLMKGDAQ